MRTLFRKCVGIFLKSPIQLTKFRESIQSFISKTSQINIFSQFGLYIVAQGIEIYRFTESFWAGGPETGALGIIRFCMGADED